MNRVFAATFLIIFTLGLGCRVALLTIGGTALFNPKKSVTRSVDIHLNKLLRSKRRIEKAFPFHALAQMGRDQNIFAPSAELVAFDFFKPHSAPLPPIFQPPI